MILFMQLNPITMLSGLGNGIMNYYEYKGHTIYPTPRLNIDSGYWRIQLTIRYKQSFRIFSRNNIFRSKGEAVFHCINYGKKLIDEGIEFNDKKG